MTDEFKHYVKELACACRDITFHGEYDLRFKFSEEPCEHDTNDGTSTNATILVNSVYLYATITAYPNLFVAYEAGDLASVAQDILHEICHIYTDPLAVIAMDDASPSQRRPFNDIIERQTERICKTLFSTLRKEWYMPEYLGVKEQTMPYTNPHIEHATPITLDTVKQAIAAPPPLLDDLEVHANPLDVTRGLLGFLAPRPVDWLNCSYAHFFRTAGIPVCEDKTFPEGKAGVWNKTRNQWYMLDLKEVASVCV